MTFTNADLHSANAKLAAIDFTPAETEAVANFLSQATGDDTDTDDVTGFNFEPQKHNGFLLEVSGFMPGTKHFTPSGKYEAPVVACSSPNGD